MAAARAMISYYENFLACMSDSLKCIEITTRSGERLEPDNQTRDFPKCAGCLRKSVAAAAHNSSAQELAVLMHHANLKMEDIHVFGKLNQQPSEETWNVLAIAKKESQ